MRANRSWTVAAVLSLAGISFFGGCGSERKAEAPPIKAVQGTEKIEVAPKVTSPSPKGTDDTGPKSALVTRPKSEKDVVSKLLLKRPSPPKPMARPIESSKIVSSLPAKIEQENNPMPPMAAAPAELNPTRPGIPPVGERHFKSAAIPSDNTQLPIDEKSYKPATVDAAEAAPAKAEPPLPAPEAAPAAPNDSPKISPAQGEYTVVKVYYGTDRAELNNLEPKQPVYLTWLIRTIVAAAVALFLSVLGFRLFPSRLIRVLAYSGMFATGVLAGLTIYARFQAPLPCDLAKTSPSASVSYGPQRGNLELGACEVSIPKSHEVGELESPSVLRLEFREDPSRHVVLLGVQPEPAERFFTDLRECVGRSSQKSAFVFVHGYNVGFEDAARRTAQIAYDLKFDGAPIFFSWPSQAEILQYTVDETNVTWTAPHLLRFLTDVAEQSGAERIHLIAHSMGNRALTSALRDLSLMHESSKPMFNEVVLTAPDIDAETFINDIAPAVVKTARRVTLYASSNDEALIMSKKVHGYPRAGDSGSQLVVVPGIDTVDVSAVDTSLLGHNYYGDNSSVLTDIFELLNDSKPADQRQWLHAERLGLLKYWVFQQ